MAATRIPFLTLISFGDIIFTGSSQPANTDNDTQAVLAKPSFDRPRSAHPSNPYGISHYAYSPGPFKGITMEWIVTLAAVTGLSTAATYQAVEDAYNTWYTAWVGTHTHKGIAGVTGQVGMLTVSDAHGVSWAAEAELTDFPTNIQPGSIDIMELTLTFTLNEAFA